MKLSNKVVSVIIPAFNEERTIANVLKATVKHPLILEVIVVDDGSIDNTSKIANGYNVRLIRNSKNLGKTMSCRIATKKAKGQVILFLDADLIGITKDNITDLVKPVIDSKVDLTMSLRGNALLRPIGIDFFTGERAIKKDLLIDPLIWSKTDKIYSLEILMNQSILNNQCLFKVIDTPNILIMYKFRKMNPIKSLYNEIKIWGFDIPKSIGYLATIKQCFAMVKLKT